MQIDISAICSEPLFNDSQSWHTQHPVFTNCFCRSSIAVPAVCLIFIFVPYVAYLSSFTRVTIRWTYLLCAKGVVGALLVLSPLLDVLKAASEESSGRSPDLIDFISPGVLVLALILSLVLHLVEQSRKVSASAVLFTFYCSCLLMAAPGVFTRAQGIVDENSVQDVYGLCTLVSYVVLVAAQLVCTCVYDRGLEDREEAGEEVFREFRSSIVSRLTFSWLDRSVVSAFKKDIGEADVAQLDASLRVKTVHGDFEKAFAARRSPTTRRPRTESSEQRNVARVNSLYAQRDTERLVEEDTDVEEEAGAGGAAQQKKNLGTSLLKAFGGQILLSWGLMLIHGLIVFVNPFLLNSMIQFASSDEEIWHGCLYAFLFFLVAIVGSVTFHSSFQLGLTSGIKIRSTLIAAVYRKSLTLTQESRARSTIGEIVNLMTVDANKIADAIPFFWCVIVSPIQLALALSMLWAQLGTAVLAGMAVFVVLIPVNFVVMSRAQKLEVKEMATKDERLKLLNEIANAMKVIKLYAWEPSFLEKISNVRKKELRYLAQVAYLFVVVIVFWTVTPFVVMLITFLTYVYSGEDHILTANKAFVSLTLFNILRFPITVLPWVVTEAVNAYVSLNRIRKFLMEDDIDETSVLRLQASDASDVAVEIDDASFAWKRDTEEPLLQNVNLHVQRGKLVAIVGKVGCGKSSLLQSILGETVKLSGSVTTRGSVAYVPQEAWIQNLTVRDNIVFGKEVQQQHYSQVVEVCQLQKDLELLSAGDATEIGERGINLSGGQKQRVSLARAVYQNCDLYLLDDPLAAVDSHVGKKLFHEVIGNSGMLAGKTRLLVTHGIHWLPYVDEIVVIDNNSISESGTYDGLLDHDGAFAKFLREFFIEDAERRTSRSRDVSQSAIDAEATSDADEDDDEEVKATKASIFQRLQSHTGSVGSAMSPPQQLNAAASRQISAGSVGSDHSDTSSKSPSRRTTTRRQSSTFSRQQSAVETQNRKSQEDAGKLIDEEGVESGRVSYKAYVFYITARGVGLFLTTVALYAAYTAVNVWSSIWLTEWTSDPNFSNASIVGNSSNWKYLRELNDHYLGVYGIFGGGIVLVVTCFGILQTFSGLRASRKIHSTLLNRLFHAPMSFFDTTPTGRIANRFSKDMEVVDRELPMVINDFIECFMQTISCVIVIAYTTPIFLAAVIPLAVIYAAVQVLYLPISRQSRRLDSKSRSPILTNFSESISGAAVIRAFRQQERFVQISDTRVDDNSRFYFLKLASNRWLGFRLELLGNLAVVIAALLAVFGRESLTPGLVGLSITYALQISDALNWMVRQLTELETDSVAVERLSEYSNVETEAPWSTETQPPSGWPAEGRVQLCNYATRYRPGLDLVLNGLNVTLEAGQRVGIVGRTGAGKSSLTLALFRIIEASFGHIEVDGVRIDRLGLHALRSALTILPQDPTVFSGSLRHNLDPFDERSDQQLWAALDTAHLSAWVRSLPEGLQHECGEGGTNLSVGQRQLVCLARALLRKSRLLVLDEATAAVDLETDSLIMSTIRQQFSSSTVIIIAHRLATIMDSDRVLVLDSGRVREFDRPDRLLAQRDSYFRFLAKEANLVTDDTAEAE